MVKTEDFYNDLNLIERKFLEDKLQDKISKGIDILSIGEELNLSDDSNIAFQVHKNIVNSLALRYVNEITGSTSSILREMFPIDESFSLPEINYPVEIIPNLCEKLHIEFLNSKYTFENGIISKEKSKQYLKDSGSVYTPKEVANRIVSECINNALTDNLQVDKIKFLDFASGTGIFYFEAINILINQHKIKFDTCVNNLYAVDVNSIAISVLRLNVIAMSKDITDDFLALISSRITCENKLHLNESSINKKESYDVIFSNPPYLNLKVNVKQTKQGLERYYKNLKEKINLELDFFRNSGIYQHSLQGMLNYYQLSIEMILKLTKSGGQIGIICPSSLFGDASTSNLRKYIIENNNLLSVDFYSEKEKIFPGVSQATSIFFIEKGGTTKNISVSVSKESFNVDVSLIKNVFGKRLEVPPINEISWSILSKLSKYKKLKDIKTIRNRRGEFDLSLFKGLITDKENAHRLVRGNMLSGTSIEYHKSEEFVDIDKFLQKKSKDFLEKDYGTARLVGQQIVNESVADRVNFIWCKETDILANSCNYISGPKEELMKIKFILNSSLIDWRFQITSTNNHVNNYELDDLPIPEFETFDINLIPDEMEKADHYICKLFGLTNEESAHVIKYKKSSNKIATRKLFNHIAPGLSDLEWSMAKHIKPGGNWKDIPENIPSKRLEQIRKSGGRTTYYGRLLTNKPAYTITTYFNRLGNSSNLHPEQQRMISIREGARIQSFKDNYIFYGPKTSQYKQIGNAVPPLLARAIAETIKPYLSNFNFIDLFAGAGGMSSGFSMEGYKPIVANEIEKNFIETYKNNHPNTKAILGDINDKKIKDKLISAIGGREINVVIGGPPCQGFSYAGWRDTNDVRNQLFKNFVDTVEQVKPDFFVMENVPGILTMRKGDAIKEIIQEFEEIGYYVQKPFLLKAEEFGVPQKRRRVFVIGSLKKINLAEPTALFSEKNSKLPEPITVGETILGLPKLSSGGGETEINTNYTSTSYFEQFLLSEIDFKTFYQLKNKNKSQLELFSINIA